MPLQSLFVVKRLVAMLALVVPQVLVSISHVPIQHLHRLVHCTAQITHTLLVVASVQSLMIEHEGLVVEAFATELTSKARSAMLLPDVLIQGARLHLLVTVGTLLLFSVPVHPLSVVVKATRKLECDTALIADYWFILIPFCLFARSFSSFEIFSFAVFIFEIL